ncbi:MAG: hypothetical protein AAF567_23970 [Actinomycetota bacterium]
MVVLGIVVVVGMLLRLVLHRFGTPLRRSVALVTGGVIAGLVFVVIAGVSGWAFFDRYWRWRGCFNDRGRCYDPESGTVFLEQAGWVWPFVAAVFAVAGFSLLGWSAWQGRRLYVARLGGDRVPDPLP